MCSIFLDNVQFYSIKLNSFLLILQFFITTMKSPQEKAIDRFYKLAAESDGICPITYAPIVQPAYIVCGHVFEWDALFTWRNTHPFQSPNHWKCPVCSYSSQLALMHPKKSGAAYFLERTATHNLPK